MINNKYKFSNLAKDLNMKNKDLFEFLGGIGITGKQHSTVIEPEEYNYIMNALTTQKQIKNLDAYMTGAAKIIRVLPAAPAEPEKPEAKPETKPEVKPAEPEKKPDPAQDAKDGREQKNGDQNKKPKDLRPGNRQQGADRFQNRPDFQNQKKEDKSKEQKNPQKQNQPQQKPAFVPGKNNDAGKVIVSTVDQQQNRGKNNNSRVVDTRTSSVDLSKYDEKLDNFVPEEVKEAGGEKQKIKKQNQQGSQPQGKNGQDKNGKNPGGFDKNKQNQKNQQNPNAGSNRAGGRFDKKNNNQNNRQKQHEAPKPQQLNVQIPDEIVVSELAQLLKVSSSEVVKRLFMLGVMANVNQTVDYDTAALIAEELGAKVSKQVTVTIEDKLFDNAEDAPEDLVPRAPVVCVMGHVDHGKTSILDAIRHTSVTAGEAGGITQHIGAYRVNINGSDITFLDTPGHEAFTAMRARGAMATDIAILVVAADDGIMPQTIEAINHAKAAGLDIIVAINKMDKPTAQPEVIKQQLTQYDLVPEEWGGDVICVPVSAVTKKGIDTLLESVLLVAEVKELKANPKRRAKGIVIEAKLDKGRGPVATVLVQNGTLHNGDVIIAGTSVGRVRAMINDKSKNVKQALPSEPVEIIGLSEVPNSGDEFQVVEDERMARELADQRKASAKEEGFKSASKVSLDDLFAQINEGTKELNVVVKADVVGSVEAVKQALLKLSNDEVKINIIHSAVGGIIESDVMLADASNAIIVGFNVRPDKNAIDSAERSKVDIRTYRIIYECIEEITAAMKGMLAPTFKEQVIGHVEIRQTIRVPNVGTIAGSFVTDGKITRKSQVRILRDSVVIAEDRISSLKRFKDDAKEVAQGYECGVGLEKFNDMKVGDVFEVYEMVEVTKE